MPSRELPDTCAVPWTSTGWTNNRNVTQMLEFMVQRGEVAVAGPRGRDRLWDLASRVYPTSRVVPADEALRIRDEQRLRVTGDRARPGPACPGEPLDVGEAGEPAVVEGVRGSGGSTRPCSASPSPAGRRYCRHWTDWSSTGSG